MKTPQHITRIDLGASGSMLVVAPAPAPKVGTKEWREHALRRGSTGAWIAARLRDR